MELTILGSGSCVARADRGPAGYMVRAGDTVVLIDAGSGTLGRMARAGVSPEVLDALFFTHAHPDHVSDLVPILFAIKHTPGVRREADLPIHGPPAFQGFFDNLMKVFGQWCVGEEYELVLREIERERVMHGSLTIQAFPVAHSLPAVGYRIEDSDGGILAITGDTGPYEGLVDLARGAEVLVSECSMPEGETTMSHMNARQAAELAQAAGVRTLVLSHLYPICDVEDVVGQARRHFTGQVAKANDLMSIVI